MKEARARGISDLDTVFALNDLFFFGWENHRYCIYFHNDMIKVSEWDKKGKKWIGETHSFRQKLGKGDMYCRPKS